ncbi:hypothetical protein EDD16DRAFT_1719722 [Pisolithus croceorrhizus]|nr:hypothetical protein EDD16DRAFT_1719722 [Pisolithus croceorrhizus]
MPLNGPEALGWALATLMLSFILGVCQAVYVVNVVGGPFNLVLVLSTVMWGTFLGIPTWHGIYSSYQEYRILLGRYRQVHIHVGVLVETRTLETPRIAPPSYEAHEFRDLDYQPDLDPVPRYPLSPPPYTLDLPVNQREINVHEHYVDWPQRLIGSSAFYENPVAPNLLGGRPNNLLELLPSTPDGDDEDPNRSLSDAHLGIQMSAVIINRNALITKPVLPSRPFPIAVERETTIALEKTFHRLHMKIGPSIQFPPSPLQTTSSSTSKEESTHPTTFKSLPDSSPLFGFGTAIWNALSKDLGIPIKQPSSALLDISGVRRKTVNNKEILKSYYPYRISKAVSIWSGKYGKEHKSDNSDLIPVTNQKPIQTNVPTNDDWMENGPDQPMDERPQSRPQTPNREEDPPQNNGEGDQDAGDPHIPPRDFPPRANPHTDRNAPQLREEWVQHPHKPFNVPAEPKRPLVIARENPRVP